MFLKLNIVQSELNVKFKFNLYNTHIVKQQRSKNTSMI